MNTEDEKRAVIHCMLSSYLKNWKQLQNRKNAEIVLYFQEKPLFFPILFDSLNTPQIRV